MHIANEWLPHARSDPATEHMQVPGEVAATPHARSAAMILACEFVCLHVHGGQPQFPPLYDNKRVLRNGAPQYARDIASISIREVAGVHAMVGEAWIGQWENGLSAAGVALPRRATDLALGVRWWLSEQHKADLDGCKIGGRPLSAFRCGHDSWLERPEPDSKCTHGQPAPPLRVVEDSVLTPVIVCRDMFQRNNWEDALKYTSLSQDLSRWMRVYHP